MPIIPGIVSMSAMRTPATEIQDLGAVKIGKFSFIPSLRPGAQVIQHDVFPGAAQNGAHERRLEKPFYYGGTVFCALPRRLITDHYHPRE